MDDNGDDQETVLADPKKRASEVGPVVRVVSTRRGTQIVVKRRLG